MRGPSTADCEKSYIRTGILTANMLRRGFTDASAFAAPQSAIAASTLIQIQPAR